LTITSLNQLPGWSKFLIALLLLDFLFWAQHYCNHKVPLLWRFHVLHHSQRELNFFTDFRYHVVEYLVRYTFIAIPLLFLRVDPPIIAAFAIFQRWYSRFYHGNIRTNLGPLKYILVTPQSHRVHHSLESSHRDKNFGAIFSVWDFLLGTQCKAFDVYPATGVADEKFPHERTGQARNLLLNPFHQMLYPFLIANRQSSGVAGPSDPPPVLVSK
jgi:sterol desaturase/sphingolipid hydroxylase (fatty acid hydroxylase superfamily)